MSRHHTTVKMRQFQQGFSLFELVVYLLVASILFATVLNRYREFPGEAERANFTAVLAQLKAGVNLQMMDMIAGGDWSRAEELEGSNPMDLMLEQPTNYVGAFALVEQQSMPRRTWYFDTSRGELVYLADNADNLYVIGEGSNQPADAVRFRITSVRAGSEAESGSWQGLTLQAVVPYSWRQVPLELPTAQASADIQ